ncbi:MAG TPA: glucan biosynthesis protein [Caulobacteraceae bacterium]|jgi:glucans biosynthesis protein
MNPQESNPPTRRAVAGGLAVAGLFGGGWASAPDGGPRLGPARPFSFEALKKMARQRARSPYVPVRPRADVEALDYDAINAIHYRPQAAVWRDRPGQAVEFFHLGRYATTPVRVSVVDGGQAREIIYDKALFDIPPGNPAARLPNHLGFAGFRVLNAGGGDWLAWLGASYFRAATPFNQYGLSARGIAIDTASPTPEEFPLFTAFWLGHDGDGTLAVFALLEGPSLAGAYRFACRKGQAGLVQTVEAELTFRRSVQRLGLAPLTSMYWYGASDRPDGADWRPQIHDSDGLAIWTGAGERIWRPLNNPPRVMSNAFRDRGPRGFGLMQRDRTFADYQDDGAFYDRRPSLWVEPLATWGEGAVELVEIPTHREIDDNIVAFWSPATLPAPGQTIHVAYRLHWSDEEPTAVGAAKVVATRFGVAGRPGQPPLAGARKFVVDFAGGRLAELTRAGGVQASVALSHGSPSNLAAYPVEGAARWRLIFDAPLGKGDTLDLRAFLRLNGEALTETWIGQAFG